MSGRARPWGILLIAMLTVFTLRPALAQETASSSKPVETPDIFIAGSDNRSFNALFIDRLREALSPGTAIAPYSAQAGSASPRTLVVTLGPAALNDVIQQAPRPPVLALMISQKQFEQYDNLQGAPVSALYLDPPLARQALLGRQILPHAATVSVLAKAGEEHLYHELADTLKAFRLELRVFTVKNPENLVATLSRALNFGDFLLGTPDPEIYNRQTIKHILLTTYRHNRILIGPERAFVQAGALASSYTTTEAFIDQAAIIVDQFLKGTTLPDAHYPERFSVVFNQQVARSLNIPLPDKDVLVENLSALEERQTGVGHD
ncbi:ABC transporter substrate-binding protein [Marinobacter fonticola]|uniref:ABC transporter substrate-binding protein n=1 Tax=Marinobacter fonticola TaxID=2603215 RepID=UPI00143DF8E6|nr:ABC transporter substrate-binding protein [Marinobacter fonticola]